MCEAELETESWFNANKLVLNKDKTQEMVFAMHDTKNANSTELKFLGLYFNHKLKWNAT